VTWNKPAARLRGANAGLLPQDWNTVRWKTAADERALHRAEFSPAVLAERRGTGFAVEHARAAAAPFLLAAAPPPCRCAAAFTCTAYRITPSAFWRAAAITPPAALP